MDLIYTLPFYIRPEPELHKLDMEMAIRCLASLEQSENTTVVVYNQGGLTNTQLKEFLSTFKFTAILLGNGQNNGIAQARQHCFEYIWNQLPYIPYIAEIHLDMILPAGWYTPLLETLMISDEPCLCASILTSTGELIPTVDKISTVEVPCDEDNLMALLHQLSRKELKTRFTHPVVHKSDILRTVGGYDCRFIKGKQGYEDDTLLLGYLYFMGTGSGWRPKCCLESRVYHGAMGQRMTDQNREADFNTNLNGLFHQYGAYGLKHLAELHNSPDFTYIFNQLLEQLKTPNQ